MLGLYAAPSITSGASGTISNIVGVYLSPTNSSATATVTNAYGVEVASITNAGTMTSSAGVAVGSLAGTNTTQLLLGTTTIPTGNYGIYYSGSNNSYLGTGNVGIGTTSPVVDGNGVIYVTAANPTAHLWGEMNVGGNATGTTDILGAFTFYNLSLGTTEKRNASIASLNDGATNSGTLQFYTASSGTLGERMHIASGGNVGIGSATPSTALDVNTGTVRAGGYTGAGIATTANMQANSGTNVVLSPATAWAASAVTALTDAATIAVDLSTGINFSVTLGGNRTLGNPSNTKVGQTGVIRVSQDATGSRTLAYGSNYKFAGGTAPVLSTAASKIDYLWYFVYSSTEIYITMTADVR